MQCILLREFTEECLIVFWTYVHALLCVYFWLFVTWAKITRSRWSYIQTNTCSKWHLTKRAGIMCHNLYVSCYDADFSKDFQLFNITNIKKQSSINRNVVFRVATTDTIGGTLESCIVFFCNLEDSHISQGQEEIVMLIVWWSTVDCTFQCLVLSITVCWTW